MGRRRDGRGNGQTGGARWRFGYVTGVATLGLIAAVGFAGVPAVAEPVATTSATIADHVKRALNIGRTANKRSVRANRRSVRANRRAVRAVRRARVPGPKGPTGPEGPPGPDPLHGRAPATEDRTLLLSWDAMGLEVRTHDPGEGDSTFEVRIVNTNPAGGTELYVTEEGSATKVNPGSSNAFGGLASGLDALVAENNGGAGRLLELSCFANVLVAGDDEFMQCMAVKAGN